MTDETASDLSYADTLWKFPRALRGEVDANEYNHVQTVSMKAQGRMKKADRRFPVNPLFHIPADCSPHSDSMFLGSDTIAEAHAGNKTAVSIFGQESTRTTWRQAHVTLALQGIEANQGSVPADTFLHDLHVASLLGHTYNFGRN